VSAGKSEQTSENETPFSVYAKTGLSAEEAQRRLQQCGLNEIPEKKVDPLRKFLGYFWGPIPWMIEIAAAISVSIQRYEDCAIIFTLLMVNAVVGFWQERQADNAIELLKKRLAPKARVLRDGTWREIDSRELVPRDVVRVRLGGIIPADVKLMKGNYLLADESALTGESLPVEKHVSEVAYAGSIVRQGEMDAYVVATGISSFFGKTTKLVTEARTESHFQKAVIRIWQLLDCSCSHNGFFSSSCRALSTSQKPHRNSPICPGFNSGCDTCSSACCFDSHHGHRSFRPSKKRSHSKQTGLDRRDCWSRHSMLGQNRHHNQE
jgi:magnesium-transporting ATPase (P-type)